jgi:hypothetical protein
VPPQDIPDGKKPMVENAGFPLQSFGNIASKTTSFGMRTIRPVAPERTERTGASISVETCMWRRIAALRSRVSSEAVSIA